ncbi:MAG: hypothetical protein ACFE8N_04010 [Promethearchaeota archaeon]
MKKKDVRRKFRIFKNIERGNSEGQYRITIGIENKGDAELENIVVRDIIPSDFNLTEFTPFRARNYKIVQIGDQSELFVNIAEIKANSSIVITYNLSGSGYYYKSEPAVIILGKDEENL